ncbi:MAG: hypothetical protein AAB822_01185 [Patescibacteria group bacterium]
MNETKHPHLKIKICVSGAAETGHCGIDALEVGKEVGREIARQGAVLVTGATTGFPLWSAMGAKEAGGISMGISPAQTEQEHVDKYKLPLEYMDLIMYTGSGYSGRNLQLTRTSDAVIVGCGRIGTLNEFTIAFEDDKPIGILEGGWETDELIKRILNESHRGNGKVIFEKDPKKMVEKIIELVNKDKVQTIKCPGCI